MDTHSRIFTWIIPGKTSRQRSLAVDYNPRGCKEAHKTEYLTHIHTHTHTHTHTHKHTHTWNKLKHSIRKFGAADKLVLREKYIGLYIHFKYG